MELLIAIMAIVIALLCGIGIGWWMAEIDRLRWRGNFLRGKTGDVHGFIERVIPWQRQKQLHIGGHLDTDTSEERTIARVECRKQRSLKCHASTRFRVNHQLERE